MNYQYISTEEMKALEGYAVDKFHVSLVDMMQKAGKAVFDVVMNNEIKPDGPVLVVVGKGNNGGDGLVVAQLLHNEGIRTIIYTPYSDDEFSPMAKSEMKIVNTLGIPVSRRKEIDSAYGGKIKFSLIIDALFGFSLKGNPRPPANGIIEQINCSKTPILSVDVPSGLDVHDGATTKPIVQADHTVALGMLKKGFQRHPDVAGQVYIGDLGIPAQAYIDLGYELPMFRGRSYILVN